MRCIHQLAHKNKIIASQAHIFCCQTICACTIQSNLCTTNFPPDLFIHPTQLHRGMKLLKIMPEMVLKKFSGSSIYRPKCSVSNLLIIQIKMRTHNYCIILLSQSVYFAIMLQAEAKASGDVMTQALPLQLGCFRSSSSIFILCLNCVR